MAPVNQQITVRKYQPASGHAPPVACQGITRTKQRTRVMFYRRCRERSHGWLLLLAVSLLAARAPAQTPPNGEALFDAQCATCHQSASPGDGRAPTPAALAQKSREEIVRALESGTMTIYGNRMSAVERRAVAAFLSSNDVSSATR